MEVRASVRDAHISPKKARLLLDTVRGKRVDEAIALLRFLPSLHARSLAKAIRSAAANAENNYNLDPRVLRVTQAWAGDGIKLKRMLPRARGRADLMSKRRSNITVIVEEER
ncbi:MAG TPA: 50S ribosomal protein L22 [Dehalococcoidia bacterium]|nr:50S ribosomal protein L22 [Dehalococcoidia bacterium]